MLGFFKAVTDPLRIASMHSPQLPARHPEGMTTPAASPNSSSDAIEPSQIAARSLFSNRTSHGSQDAFAALAALALFTLAGPNASKWTCDSGTPHSQSAGTSDSINPAGPHT